MAPTHAMSTSRGISGCIECFVDSMAYSGDFEGPLVAIRELEVEHHDVKRGADDVQGRKGWL